MTFCFFFKQRGHFCLWSLEVAGEDLSVRQLPHLEGAVCAAGVEQRPGQAHLGHSLAHVLEQTVPAHSTPHNSGQIGQNIRSKKSVHEKYFEELLIEPRGGIFSLLRYSLQTTLFFTKTNFLLHFKNS